MVLVVRLGTACHFPTNVEYTYIMEPSRSLHTQIFSKLDRISYRNLSEAYNPLDIPNIPYVDYSKPMDILISQDCSGFNLGSFLLRRSEFTHRLLDMWWDPVFYEQKYLPLQP
jgi:mannan polymerase II complex MNN10 subunit